MATEHWKCGESKFRCAVSVKYTSILKILYENKNVNYLMNNFLKHITIWNDNILDILDK